MSLTTWLIAAGVFSTLLGAVYWLARAIGRKEAQLERELEEAEAGYEARKDANRREREIAGLGDDELNSRLRKSDR